MPHRTRALTALPPPPPRLSSRFLNRRRCLDSATVLLYKYTLSSSKPKEDGEWADGLFGCSFRNVTDTHGCSELGKTSCVSNSLAFGLHFVHNEETPAGPRGIKEWDEYMYGLNAEAFENDKYSQFMDYSLTFYSPNMTDTLHHLVRKGTKFLVRKTADSANVTWYTAIIQSKSGKVFEITSPVLEEVAGVKPKHVKEWSVTGHAGECAAAHLSTTYSERDYDFHYHGRFSLGHSKTSLGLSALLPIRTNIAVPNLDNVVTWYRHNIPSLEFKVHRKCGGHIKWATVAIPSYTEQNYTIEVRFVENGQAMHGDDSVSDFVSYVDSVNRNYTGVNYGWSAWYDRHLGIMLSGCPLDDYMKNFAARGVSFHPHGRDNMTTKNTGTPTDHCWTEGTAGFGLEMQGNFSYEFRSCYEVFNWCMWDTDPPIESRSCSANGEAHNGPAVAESDKPATSTDDAYDPKTATVPVVGPGASGAKTGAKSGVGDADRRALEATMASRLDNRAQFRAQMEAHQARQHEMAIGAIGAAPSV